LKKKSEKILGVRKLSDKLSKNKAIKKVIWEIPIIVTLNLTFHFNPRKTDFSLKKSQNQKNLISEKTWQKILYKKGVSKKIYVKLRYRCPLP
jgi:hypothetical protein